MVKSKAFDNFSLEYDKWFEKHEIEYQKNILDTHNLFKNTELNIV